MTISSLLVANRGEIARRVFRSARAMGMRCIAVYVDADADAPFVADADEAVRLDDGGYLDAAAMIAAAQLSGADAIHPGYGFLSENADFARAVGKAGIAWVGPSPVVIASMGDKLAAKRVAAEAGVPTLPSSEDLTDDGHVGYPLLVKASAGGGGKGMRVVDEPEGLAEAIASAKREAAAGFGDDTVFLERYVAISRHVEIQILGDQHGGLVHLGERECSIQRRHQKIIEESPSPIVDDAMRAEMGRAALALGQAMGYESAGTVEFLVDDNTREFFFLEINTRLQVEHPVTEEVTGLDLVREQLRVAGGEALGYGQDDITFTGHAIEARLYAEDPATDFLPAIGTLEAFEPAADPAVRWDAGVVQGSTVTIDFDPMIAKVVAHGPTRTEAAGRLALALERLHLGGLTTNRDFLAATLRTPEFLAGDTTTDFIARVRPARRAEISNDELGRAATAAALWIQAGNRANASALNSIPSGWRNSRTPPELIELVAGDRNVTVRYRRNRDDSFATSVEIGDEVRQDTSVVHGGSPDEIDIRTGNQRAQWRITRVGDAVHVTGPVVISFSVTPRFVVPGTDAPTGGFVAPMPGTVLELRVAAGDTVSAGDTLVVLEAMKMEQHMNAPADGIIADVLIVEGGQVETGQVLLVFEDAATSDDESSA
jgi:propionyl-CoA carboxylase alpha chain